MAVTGGRHTSTATSSTSSTVVSANGTGMSGSTSTSSAVTGIAVLTTRSACGRIATSHTPIRNTAIGIVYANDAHGASSALSPPSTSISTSMPAEKAAAAAKMK